MPAERIDVPRSPTSQQVDLAVQHLRRSQDCVLPSETVYGLALPMVDPASTLPAELPTGLPTFHCVSTAVASELVDLSDVRLQRLCARYWPGPLTVIANCRHEDRRQIAVRVPANAFLHGVLAAHGRPLCIVPLPEAVTAERALGLLGAQKVEVAFDAGPCPLGLEPTVVRIDDQQKIVVSGGILSATEIMNTAAATILFVCTGNTCRSPMAEAIARHAVAKALRVRPEEVAARGLRFCSAGTGTMDGVPASDGSMAAAAEVGIDLSQHASTSLDHALAARATRIHCLSNSHLLSVLDLDKKLEDRVSLLRPDGRDIADPYGSNLLAYRAARDQITAAVEARVKEWLALLPDDPRKHNPR